MARNSQVCGMNPRQQLNENTAYLDGSQLYGSSLIDAQKFRDGGSGFMRMDGNFGRSVLPSTRNGGNIDFQAGDDRVNVFVGLAAFHILFTREHNRLVNQLRQINPQWDGDRLYQEARKIVGAQIQAITYREYLPKLLGSAFETSVGSYKGYDPNVNAGTANHFMAAAFRFGHAMITETFPRLAPNGGSIPQGSLNFLDGVQHSERLLQDGGIDPILRGLLMSPAKRPHRVTPSATERLFGNQVRLNWPHIGIEIFFSIFRPFLYRISPPLIYSEEEIRALPAITPGENSAVCPRQTQWRTSKAKFSMIRSASSFSNSTGPQVRTAVINWKKSLQLFSHLPR